MSEWQFIETAPGDFSRPGGQRPIIVRTVGGHEYRATRTLWNNTGWREVDTNKEINPLEWWWDPDGRAPEPPESST